jgi:hypothetical protein
LVDGIIFAYGAGQSVLRDLLHGQLKALNFVRAGPFWLAAAASMPRESPDAR